MPCCPPDGATRVPRPLHGGRLGDRPVMDASLERLDHCASNRLEVGPFRRLCAELVDVGLIRLADMPDDLREVTPSAARPLLKLDVLGGRGRGIERGPART